MSLVAVAVTQLTQQMQGLQQMHLASYNQTAFRHSSTAMGPSSQPVVSMQQKPMDQAATPVRKQARREDKAVRMALKQREDAGVQVASGSAAMQLPAVPGAQAMAVPLTVGPRMVHPGRATEIQWTSWKGR